MQSRINPPRLTRVVALTFVAILVFASASYAQLFPELVDIAHPKIAFDSDGVTTYDSSTHVLSIVATTQTMQMSEGPSFCPFFLTPGTTRISVQVDQFGALLPGVPGDDLVIMGGPVVPIPPAIACNPANMNLSGLLMRGTVQDFGYRVNPDQLVFRFSLQAGAFYDLGLREVAVKVSIDTANQSTFTGRFDIGFSGGAVGDAGVPLGLLAPGPTVTTSNLLVGAPGPGGAIATFTATASGFRNPSLDVTCSPASGSVFPFGTTTVMCTSVADLLGQVGTGELMVTVLPPPPTCTGVIGDFVWNDLNQNGIRGAREVGIADVPVVLYKLNGTIWEPHTTDVNTNASGEYLFGNLCAGTYQVEAITPAGYTASAAGRGLDRTVDSNLNPSIVVLGSSDSSDRTIDFGFYVASPGPFITFTQGGWGAKPAGSNPAMLLKNNFSLVYPALLYPLGVVIGDSTAGACPADGTAPYRINLTSASAIRVFLPQGGRPVRLKKCQTNPTRRDVSLLAGQMLALKLNVDFSEMGVTHPGLADLVLAKGPLAGSTVAQVLDLGHSVLAGGALPPRLTRSELNKIIRKINRNFPGGTRHRRYLQLNANQPMPAVSAEDDVDPDDLSDHDEEDTLHD